MYIAGPLMLWILADILAVLPAKIEPWHESVASPYALPGGVADPAGRTGFLINAEGGVTALDLRSGRVLWETASKGHPLVVASDRLYVSVPAGPDHLRILAFDIMRKGEVVFESDPVTVSSEPGQRPQTLHWTPDKDRLRVTWKTAEDSDVQGSAEIDLRTGHVHLSSEGCHDQTPAPPSDLAKRVVRWQGIVANMYKALVLEESEMTQHLVFYEWNTTTKQPQTPRELLQGKRLLVRATVDDQYLCLRDAVPSPDRAVDERGRDAWSIFSTTTGEWIARLPYEPGTHAIAVLGPRAYCLVSGPPVRGKIDRTFVHGCVLKAIDLKTGKTLWERPSEGKQLTSAGK